MKKLRWFSIIALLSLVVTAAPLAGTTSAQGDSHTFTETGHTVKGKFLAYWTNHGGLAQQGYPISEEMQQVSETDGKVYTMQYFERAVFELHPENAAPNDVLLSLLGVFYYKDKYPSGAPSQKVNSEAGAQKFTQTGHTVGGKFLAYWNQHGGLAQQGYPISEEFQEVSALNGKTYTVQYFERAVFELHPENQAPNDVLLSQLGTFRLRDLRSAINYPTGSGSVTLWHGYTGSEADTLTKAVGMLQSKNPNFKVTVLAVPFDQLQNKFTTEASAGGGPDLVIGPNDWIGPFTDAKLLANIDDNKTTASIKTNLVGSAVNVANYGGHLAGIPTSLKNVALYYNKDIVKTLPKTTDDMISMSAGLVGGNVQYGLALNLGFYQQVGYNFAFGGKLFTDNAGKTVDFTSAGSIAWLNWLAKAKAAKGVFAKSGADQDIDNLFKNGQAGMVINGPWALNDYVKALGKDKVGVAIAPSTPSGGKFAPFVGTENYFVSANTKDVNSALAFINFISSPGIQSMFVKDAGQISTNTMVDLSSNPLLQQFVEQAKQGTPFPSFPGMAQVWTPAGDMITKVTDGKATADQAAKDATDAINKAIASGGSSK